MNKIFGFLTLMTSLSSVAYGGPYISGGADGCTASAYEYECYLISEDGNGGTWRKKFKVTNDGVQPSLPARVDLGICGNPTSDGKEDFYAWLSLNSRKDPSISALAQIDIDSHQNNFNLLVNLAEGAELGGFSYYAAKCKKLK